MLSVGQFKPQAKRSTEAAVERLWAETWKQMGIYSRHMSDAIPGLPDRYIRGGRWVEFKSLYRKRGGFTHGEGMSPEQRRVAADLLNAGDKVWYIAQLDGWEEGKCYLMVPMAETLALFGDRVMEGRHPTGWLQGANADVRKWWTEQILG